MYKFKKGYVLGDSFKEVIDSLTNDIDISWYEHKQLIGGIKPEIIFWANMDAIFKSDYILVDEKHTDTFVFGVTWTINYIRKLLSRSGHKDALKQLDKFELVNKNIVGINTSPNTAITQIAVKDQGKEFKNIKAIVKYITSNEK
jgi:hypothetical protein